MALRDRRLAAIAALALFAALTALHTWPLVAAPHYWSRFDNADAELNAWALTWVARALVRDPLHVFDAPIFFPERDTLAYSEHLILQGALVAPLVWLGASPLLASNVVLLAGLTLSGWVSCLVFWRWTGSLLAGVLGGSVVAYNTHLLTRLAHVQAMHVEFLALALYALDRTIASARVRHALLLSITFTLQALCSGYLLMLSAVSLVVSGLVRVAEWCWPPRPAGRRIGLLALAAGLSVVCLLPFLEPYQRVHDREGLVRSLDEVAFYSAEPADYLTTVARVHYATWSRRFYTPGDDSLFPGFVPLLLAAVALLTGVALRDARARMLLAAAIAGCALSFGPAMPGYAWLYHHVRLFEGVRGAARFGYLLTFGVGGLAAFGLARWTSARAGRPGGMSRAQLLAACAVILVNLEAWTSPLHFTPFTGVSPVYRVLAREPAAVVVEFPFPPSEHISQNGNSVLANAYYLKPLVNGYSGFTPHSYHENARALAGFPDEASRARLTTLGVTHVIVHASRMPPGEFARLAGVPWLSLRAAGGDTWLYERRETVSSPRPAGPSADTARDSPPRSPGSS